MTRPIQRRPILRRSDRAILAGTVAALVLAILVSPALAGPVNGQVVDTSSRAPLVAGTIRGFNPQPEPPPLLDQGIKGLNPQPEPPSSPLRR